MHAAQSPASQSSPNTASTVSSVVATETDKFIDVTLKGKDEREFKDKFVRFVTPGNPDGFVARVKAFDPATGEFTLYAKIPAGLVKQNDVYQLGSTASISQPAGAADAAAQVGCTPPGSPASDSITCTGTDTAGVISEGGHDVVNVEAGASVNVSAAGIRTPEATAVSAGDDGDTVTNAGTVSASATAVLTPVLTPPSPVPGISKVWAAAIATGPEAKGIDGGPGNDTITNTSTGSVSATATSVILPSIVNGTAEGLSKADVSSTSKATATAIAGGEGADTLINSGTLDPSATATALGVNLVMTSVVEVGKGGTSTVKGNVKAESMSTGLSAGDGNDAVTNHAAFGATSGAHSIAAAASTLDAKGSVAASASATGEAKAGAIDLGAGNDTLTNLGDLTASANATAHAVNVSIAENTPPPTDKKEKVKAVVDGGATANAHATGIGADSLSTSTEIDPVLINDGVRRGLSFGLTWAFASGNDEVTNAASVAVTATAQSGAAGVTAGMSIDGSAAAKVTSTAEAHAAGVDLGGGNDRLTNAATGQLTAFATATAQGLNASIVAKSDPAKKGEIESTTDGSVKAEAHAAGLAADSVRPDVTYSGTLTTGDGFRLHVSETKARASGNDDVTNSGVVTGIATSTAGALGVGMAIDGKASAKMSSSAEANAVGIDLGGGNDALTNNATGQLTATATATAKGLNVALGIKTDSSDKSASESTVEGSVKAESNATGLGGDSLAADRTREGTLTVGDGALGLNVKEVETRAAGNDTVTNSGVVTANATSTTEAAGVGVTIDGKSTAKIDSKAEANAAGIDLGGGKDTLTNTVSGQLTATATATAAGLNVAIGVKTDPAAKSEAKSTVEGSVEAKSQATGLGADSLAGDRTREATLTVDGGGLGLSAKEIETRATGNDTVTNSGVVSATATSTTLAGGLGIAIDGKTTAKMKSEAEANAGGIDLGGGNDVLTNTATGHLTATATATATGLNVAVGVKSDPSAKSEVESAAEGSVESKSQATGLGADSLSGDKTREASLVVDGSGFSLKASESETRASGNDAVTNNAAVTATATSTTLAGGVGVTINGEASAKITSEAEAGAAAIDLGGGNDKLTNGGTLTAGATATAATLNVAVGVSGDKSSAKAGESKSKTAADGSATAESRATGLAADSVAGDTTRAAEIAFGGGALTLDYSKTETRATGNDEVTNTGAITAASSATSGAVGVGVTVKGAASANSKSTAESSATAIDLGGGQDTLTNSGNLLATASSLSGAVKVAVSTEGRAVSSDGLWQGGIKSEASAAGIDAGGVNSESTSVKVVVDGTGIHGLYETIKDSAGAAGRDVITNTGSIEARALSLSGSANVSVTSEGTAAAISHVEAEAEAAGLRAGNGNDDIKNLGPGSVLVTSTAEAGALKVVASGKGTAVAADALWDSGTKSEATAIGINSDAGELEKTLITAAIDANGVLVEHEKTTTVSSGNDTILNEQAIGATATSSAPSLSMALEAKKGIAAAISKVSSEAEAAAVRAGGGNDTITNRGALTSTAAVTAETANFSIAKDGLAAATDSVWDGGTKAEATALGIDADGPGNTSKKTTLTVNSSGATIVHTDTVESATGNDTVVNEARIDANATATARSLGVALTAKGLSAALSQSTAKAETTAIRGGDGHDGITNTGALTSTATSNAQAASVAVTVEKGVAAAGNAVWDGGITAEATAIGIEGDGGDKKTTTTLTIKTGGGGDIDKEETKEAASGNDTITNSGAITSTATATAPEVSVSIATKGVAAAISTSTAKSNAAAIDAGGGNDHVSNTGKLTADATSFAIAINGTGVDKGVAISANNSWDGGVKADARARGIDGGAGFDSLTNAAEISAHSKATAPSVSVAVAITGVPIAVSTATATSNATAIDAGGGTEADQIVNLIGGKLTSHAEALAATANVAVTNQGLAIAADAVWDGGTKAEAAARGIDAGQGADTIANAGEIEATSDAIAASVAVSVAVTGVAAATATSTATSTATAIDTGDGQDIDVVGNLGKLLAKSHAFAGSASVSVTNSGVSAALDAVWDGGTKANAMAAGISTGGADDVVTNAAQIEALSDAKTGAAAVSVAVSGVAGASATSTGTSIATAIDTGESYGVDRITNTGKLIAEADALAISTSVSVTNAGVALASDAVWNGGTTAEAIARGIRAGLGADAVTNSAEVEARAGAIAGSAAVSVAVSGVAAAIATSTGKAQATAIDSSAVDTIGTGNDADTIANTGKLTADSSAIAATVTVGVTTAGVSLAGDAAWDGGTKAEAVSKGIAAGAGADTVLNEGEIAATSDAITASLAVSVAVTGAAGAVGTSTGVSNATAIDAGDGADAVVNRKGAQAAQTGKLIAQADALAAAATVTVTTAGVAVSADSVWDGGTKAEATAKGIDAGLGADTVTNESDVEAKSGATTASVAVSVAITGVAGAIAGSTSTSSATAIDAGSGAGADTIANSGHLKSTADALSVSAAIGFTTAGLSLAGNAVWDGGTRADAIAQGIAGSQGADTVTNSGLIETMANSDAVSATLSVAVAGVAGAVSTATAEGQSTAIDGGAGNDVIQNMATGVLNAKAEATGVAVNVGITGAGVTVAADSVWDGGTKAEATAKGIHGGMGLDAITNNALISADAVSTTASVAVSLTGIGAGGAVSTSTSTANATAIDGGGDADLLTNRANLTATSNATATGVAVTVTGIGGSVAGDAFWDGGTAANANSTGIAGGAGDDTVANTANMITADARSKTNSVSIAVTGVGLAGVAAGSTSTARATAIDGQEGSDTIANDRALDSKASSTASGVGVAVSLAGGSLAGSFVDNVTKAEAIATGIAGGASADTITNTAPASIALTSGADSTDTNVSVTLVGVADGQSQALTISRGTGIDGGDGNDTLNNVGSIAGTLTADLTARSISVSLGGATGNASGTAETIGTGLEGGADNDVVLNNGRISLASTSTAASQTVAVGVTGGTLTDASGTGRATLFGLAGGSGNDILTNNGIVSLLPTAQAFGQNVGVSVLGGSVNNASALSQSIATALFGGAGDDAITNNNILGATASATTTARSTGVVILGSTVNKSNANADAAVIGIDGGDNADRIVNAFAGNITIRANATATADSVTVGIIDSTIGESHMTPLARATGLDGGAGDDEVINDGRIDVRSQSTGSSSNSTTQVFGSTGTTSGTTADAFAFGLNGGDGADLLVNRGVLTLNASSSATVGDSSWTLAGGAGASAALRANGGATGIAGAAGADRIRNEGTVTVNAGSALQTTGGSRAIFGGASSSTQLVADTRAFGLTGGDGANTIENILNVDVNSTATVTSSKTSVSFAGSPSTDALLAARAAATGIEGGNDADVIRNDGTIGVDAKSTANVSGGASAEIGGSTTSNGFATADATARGIDAGAGHDSLTNTKTINVEAVTDSVVANSSSAGFFFSDGTTASNARTTVGAIGLAGGAGDNLITNRGDVRVSTLASGHAFAYAVGGSFSIEGDANATSDVRARATATGVSAGDGVNRITNDKLLSVSAFATTSRVVTTQSLVCSEERVPQPDTCTPTYDGDGNQIGETCTKNPDQIVKSCTDQTVVPRDKNGVPLGATPTFAGANGNGASGDGVAIARGTADAEAYGIDVGNGANTIANNQEISVSANPDARVTTFADGDAFGDADGISVATANATAVGIRAGNGNNAISNAGTLTVMAAPTAQARAEVSGGDICIWYLFGTWCGGGGDGEGDAKATFRANATGIMAGDGDNQIVNDGSINVTAAPAVAGGFTTFVDGDGGPEFDTSVTSRAVGIQTGNGNNQVVNNGTINIEARDAQIAYTCTRISCTPSLQAIGIQTGGGNDLIVNDGTISTSIVAANGSSTRGIAISSGAGNDEVILGEGSTTSGAVQLGTGNDTLVWSANASLTGGADGATGTDMFALGGSGNASFNLSEIGVTFNGFELFQKRGSSTWTLLGDRRIDWSVTGGTLAIAGAITGTIDTSDGAMHAAIAVRPGATIRRDDGLAPAVILRGGSVLSNQGLVEATTGSGDAVSTFGNGNQILNSGQIRSAGDGIQMSGNGNLLSNTGTVQSTGGSAVVITGQNNALVNEGLIRGVGEAVSAEGANSVTNHGSMIADGVGIRMNGAGGTIVNEGLVSSVGVGGAGIVLAGDDQTLTNRGAVTALGPALRFESAAGSAGSVVNEVSGLIRSTGGLAIQGGDGSERIANHGTIAGGAGVALDLAGGSDELLITATSQITGIARGGEGFDTFVLAGPKKGRFDLSGIGPVVNGFERFRKQGSPTWTLFGKAQSDWTVDESTLEIEGSVTGTVDTSAGAPNALIDVLATGAIGRDDGLAAVVLNGGAVLNNAGLVSTTTGAGAAVQALGDGNLITNTGRVLSAGIGLQITGEGNLLNNTGSVGAAGSALVLTGAGNSIFNDGTLETTGAAPAVSTLGSGNAITNSGDVRSAGIGVQISGNGNLLDNRGAVSGTGGALALTGASNSLVNHGFIQAIGGGAAVSTRGDANQITNGGEVRSAGIGLQISGDGNLLRNAGLVTSAGGAVVMTGAGNSLLNDGLLATTGPGVAVQALGDANRITNGGQVRAAGSGFQISGAGNLLSNVGSVRSNSGAVTMTGASNSIFNYGVIETTGAGIAVSTSGGGNQITNYGSVRSSGIGLQFTGDSNLFNNAGTMQSIGAGVVMGGGKNSIFNAGLIDVTGNGAALQALGNGNQITNSGNVRSAGAGLQATGQGNVLNNPGTVRGIGGTAAVAVAGNGNSISNAGLIEATGGGAAVQIDGSATRIVNSGEVRSTATGLQISGSGNTIDNNGLIRGNAEGVRTAGSGTLLVNRGTVSGGGSAVVMTGSGETLTNLGLVTAGGSAVRIESAPGSTTTVVNEIGALIESTGGMAILGGEGNDRVENRGMLVGGAGISLDLGGGNDVLHLTTTAFIQGTARGGAGVDSLVLAGTGRARTDLATYSGFETLRKDDTSSWTLTGAGDMSWTLNAGQLVVEGTLAGQGIVQAAGRLAGNGTVGGFVNEGTVAPGNSIGTITVLGDYQHAPGATLEIESAITGQSDALKINGRAVLNGGTVTVLSEARPYGVATEHTILNAAGGVTGTFGTVTSDLAYLDPFLDYEAQKVYLTLIRNDVSFRAMGNTSNTQALGTALDSNKKAMARGDFKGLMDQFLLLDKEQQRQALQTLDGELHATTARTLLHTGNRFFSALVDRQLSARRVQDERKTFWTDAVGFSGSLEDDGNASGARYRSAGFAAGADLMVTDATRIGAAMGFAPGTTELNRVAGGSARSRSYQPAVYGEHDAGSWSLGLGLGYGRHNISTARGIEVGPIARRATADYRADQYSGLLRAGVSLRRTQSVSVKVFGELGYSALMRHAFDEAGADSASLTSIADARTDSLKTLLGVRASWEPRVWRMRVKPELKAGWAHESLDQVGELTAGLTGAAAVAGFQRFLVLGATEARDSAVLSLGATSALIKNGRAFLAYDANLSDRGSEHGFAAGIRISW